MRCFPHSFRGDNIKLLKTVKQVLKSASDQLPMGVRSIFYLVISLPNSPLENTKKEYNRLSRLLGNARWCGEVSFNVIEDSTRYTSNEPCSLETALLCYYPEAWKDQPNYVEVFVEKEGLRSPFRKTLRPYYVKVTPTSGFDSLTNVGEAAQRLHKYRDRPRYIIVFSDFDPSGECISYDFAFRLKKRLITLGENATNYNESTKTVDVPNLKISKVALTMQQIEQHQLPPKFVKAQDPRAESFIEKYGENVVVELDAMPLKVLRQTILDSIKPYLDMDEVARIRELEQRIRTQGLEALEELVALQEMEESMGADG